MGGLGFVETLSAGLTPLSLALSVVVASRWAHDALYHGQDVRALRGPAAALLLVNLFVGLFVRTRARVADGEERKGGATSWAGDSTACTASPCSER